MNKSDLIEIVRSKQTYFSDDDVKQVINLLLNQICTALIKKHRVEIRGFGSFSLKKRKGGKSRNPKTGEIVYISEKYYASFKPSKELSARVKNI